MNHLIEHVIDPHEILKKTYKLIDKDGVFYGRTPKRGSLGNSIFGRFWGRDHFPRHLHSFTEDSLKTLLLNSGFREVEIVEDLNLFPALSLQNFLLGKLKLKPNVDAGHTKLWGLLVLLTAPLSIFDYLIKRDDCMKFIARK
jgi:hypothetical protein